MSERFKIAPFIVCLSLLAVSLIVFAPIEEEADAWQSVTLNSSSYTGYRCGNVRYDSSSSTYSKSSNINSYFGDYTSTDNYRGWLGIPISSLDDEVYLSSATLNLRIQYYSGSSSITCYVRLLDVDPRTASPQNIYSAIRYEHYCGSISVSSSTTSYSMTLSSSTISVMTQKISDGDEYLFFGFYYPYYNPGTLYYVNSDNSDYNSYLTLQVDQSAPDIPTPTGLSTYSSSSSVTVSYGAVNDNPSRGSYGGVQYQVGLFASASAAEPYTQYPWTSSLSTAVTSLGDGATYYFKVRSKDGLGFTSSWSSAVSTTIDRTPPTTPVIYDLPEYTNGTSADIQWLGSVDSVSGVDEYTVATATMPNWYDQVDYFVSHPTSNYLLSMVSGETYYITVRAEDNMGLYSSFSPITHTTSDADPPTIPVMMNEPPYTKGETNTFSWHPAVDEGVGVHHYKIQVATTDNFQAGTIVYDMDTDQTYAYFEDLDDDVKYYARVQAVDDFHYESDWSEVEWSIQDHRGPGELGLTPLMEYLPAGTVNIEWEGAEDGGSGVDHYKVIWSTDATFTTEVHSRDDVLGQSFLLTGLTTDTKWFIKVLSYDNLGNPGAEEVISTTIDATPPTLPVMDTLDEYSGGRTTTVAWSESTDALAGLDHYVLNVYTSPDRVGLAFTVHTTDLTFDVPGLSDGTIYHYEVIAYDRAGNDIASAMVHSMQDSTGPSIPNLIPMDPYQKLGIFKVEWGPSTDNNEGVVEYQAQWATDILFSQNVMESTWLTGTHYEVFDIETYTSVDTRAGLEKFNYPLDDGIYYIRVRSRDTFGQLSGWGNSLKTVVDTTAPEVPVIIDLPQYSGGTDVRIGWEKVFDPVGTGIEYRVQVFENETGDPIRETSWTDGLSMDISDLTAYKTYYFKVQARDALGWISDPSAYTYTTMDIDGPKITMLNDGIFGPSETHIVGDAADLGCGVDLVEFSVDGGLTWVEAEIALDRWSFPKSSLPTGTKEVMVRGQDLGGNIGNPVMAYIDEAPPVITISYPTGGTTITGVTSIIGSVTDDHLTSYSISYQREGADTWEAIVPTQTTGGVSGLLGTWAPDGLSGGEYTIKVTAVDSLGMISEETLNVTIAGANLNIDPAQITFSNHHPLPGDKVTVMVTILNFGDSPAEGITLVIKDGDKIIHTEGGILVPANGIVVVTTEITASGTHTITAQATSELYDSGEMSQGAVLEVSQEESILENAGGILGLIALILAIIAILLIFVFKGKKEKEPKEKDEKKEEAEEKTEEEEMKKAPPMSLPTGEPEKKPALPEAPKQKTETPALPSASSPTPAPIPPAPKPAPAEPAQAPTPPKEPEPAVTMPALQPAPAPPKPPVGTMPTTQPAQPELQALKAAPTSDQPSVQLP